MSFGRGFFSPLLQGFVPLFDCCLLSGTVDAGENTGAAADPSKLSDQDKVQWLTGRLAHSVTDLSRTRPDQTGSGTADKERWVTGRKRLFYPIFTLV